MANLDKAVKNLQEGIEKVKETTDDRNAVKQASEDGIAKATDTEAAADVLIVEEGLTDPFAPGHDKAAEKAAQAGEAVVMTKDQIADLEGRELTREEKFERLAADPDSSLGFDSSNRI